jgi:hypothetical protein
MRALLLGLYRERGGRIINGLIIGWTEGGREGGETDMHVLYNLT